MLRNKNEEIKNFCFPSWSTEESELRNAIKFNNLIEISTFIARFTKYSKEDF